MVEGVFGAYHPLTGDYNTYKPYDTSKSIYYSSPSSLTLDVSKSDTDHPILEGVSSFNAGTSSYYHTNIEAVTGATEVAVYSNGEPLVLVKESVVLLNFWPVSKDADSRLWDNSTDGDLLMANALRFVGRKE